jgi:5-(carboxyamino)imidazole ribonucleotide synthase
MKTQATIGIIGGGQLARMLVEAASRLGISTRVLASGPDDPAAKISEAPVYGGLSDRIALRRFFSEVSLVLFENEFVDTGLLEDVAKESGEATGSVPRFIPSLKAIETLQDKVSQKKVLEALGIPSAPFLVFTPSVGGVGLRDWISRANVEFDGQAVFKWARLGYDGKGTLIGPRPEVEIERFCKSALEKGVTVFAEKKIEFSRELAIASSRSMSEFVSYPLVVSEQRAGICRNVFGPASAFGVSQELESCAADYARRIADHLGFFGVHAIEFFLCGQASTERLFVNELAPRVHNSAHYTQDACAASQFENHVRAAMGMKLGVPASAPRFLMRNLIAPGDDPRWALPPRLGSIGRLHWYGKRDARAGRKMGHINVRLDPSPLISHDFDQARAEIDRIEKEWEGK